MPTPKCGICDDDFSSEDGDHSPRNLNLECCHTLCEGCIKTLLKNCRIVCPFCREPTDLPGNNIKSLHKNFLLIEIIQLMGKTPEVEKTSGNFPPKCEEHPYNLAEFVCIKSDCSSKNKFMCRTCEENGAHKGHEKELLISKAAELRKQLECWLKQIKLNIQHSIVYKNGLEEAVESNEKLLNTKLRSIKNHFNQIRQSVDEKEEVIIHETTTEAKRIRELNNGNISHLISFQALLVQDFVVVEKRKNMNDIDLYTTGIDLAGKWSLWSRYISDRPPAETKGMDVKLPNFKFED